MTLVTVGRNGRAYQRKFDHDDALRRYADGASVNGLATEYGVSWAAVARVVIPGKRVRMDAATRAHWLRVCEDCRGPAVHNDSGHTAKDGRILCRACRGLASRTRFETTPGGVVVAATCFECKRVLPLDEFSNGPKYHDVRRGGVHSNCRECATTLRQAYRIARKVPCSHGCGTLVCHEQRKVKPPECRPCFLTRRSEESRAFAASTTSDRRAVATQKVAA